MEDRQAPVGQTKDKSAEKQKVKSRQEAIKALESIGFVLPKRTGRLRRSRGVFDKPHNLEHDKFVRELLKRVYSATVKIEPILKAVDIVAAANDIELSGEARREAAAMFEADFAAVVEKYSKRDPSQKSPDRHSPLVLPTEIPDDQKYAAWSKINERSIIKFFEEGWPAPFIKASILTRSALFNLDRSAYKALTNFLERGNALPSHLELPTRSHSRVTTELAHVDREALREAERLARALRRREHGR